MKIGIGEFLDNVLNMVYEVTRLGKAKNLQTITAKVIYPNGNIRTYKKTLVTKNETFINVPEINRSWILETIHEEDKGRTAYLSLNNHKSINIRNFQTPVTYDVTAKFRHLRKWITFEITGLTGSINLNLLDNTISQDFISDTHKVIKTKTLEFLESIEKRVYLLTMFIAGLSGIIIGIILGIIGALLLLK